MARHSNDREQKKREKQKRLATLEQRKWQPFARVLSVLSLPPAAEKAAKRMQDWLFKRGSTSPEVILDRGAASVPEGEQLRRDVERIFDEVRVDGIPALSAGDFLSVVRVLSSLFNHLRITDATSAEQADLLRTRDVLNGLKERCLRKLVRELSQRLELATVAHSRIDRQLFWVTTNFEDSLDGRLVFRARIYRDDHQKITVTVDEIPRRAYRCGGGFIEMGVQWASWRGRDLGIGLDEQYDVYVQTHALERLHERVPFSPDYHVHDGMVLSLCEPLIVENRGDEFLVEYRFFKKRLGYFVAQRVDKVILVRTFLFLTMQGTPESHKLYERLRLRRYDIEHLHLDSLSYFLATDVQADPMLAEIFEECGCGHLLQYMSPAYLDYLTKGTARKTREYIGLEPPEDSGVLSADARHDGTRPTGKQQGTEPLPEVQHFLGNWLDCVGRLLRVEPATSSGCLVTLLERDGKTSLLVGGKAERGTSVRMPASLRDGNLVVEVNAEEHSALVLTCVGGGTTNPEILLGLKAGPRDGDERHPHLITVFRPPDYPWETSVGLAILEGGGSQPVSPAALFKSPGRPTSG